MGESFAHIQTSNQSQPEYVIYTFRKETGSRGADIWQNMGASNDITVAKERAQNLFRSSRYSRIELRKKFISERTGAVIDIPVEVLSATPDTSMRQIILLLSIAMGCALIAFALSLTL
jgi:hypothetical protein